MKINELGDQPLLINLNHFTSNCLMITFILASIYSDVRGAGALLPLSSPLCVRLRDEAEAWMMRGGRWIYN